MAIVLEDTGSGYNLSTINNNFKKIEDELNNKVLRRDINQGEGNEMNTHLDLNNERGVNCADAQDDSDIPNFGQLKLFGSGGESESEAWAEVSRLYSVDSENSSVVSQAQVPLCQDEVVNATNAGNAQVVLAQAEVVKCEDEVVLAVAAVVDCQAEVILAEAETALCVIEKDECTALAGTAGTFATDAALSADEANGYVSTSELEVIARSLNILDAEVIYATDLVTELDAVSIIFNAATQIIWNKPPEVGAGEVIVSVVGSLLTTDVTTYTLYESGIPFTREVTYGNQWVQAPTTDGIRYFKVGNVCTVYGNARLLTTGTHTIVCTTPVGFRPSEAIYAAGTVFTSAGNDVLGYRISSDGNLVILNGGTTTAGIFYFTPCVYTAN